MPAGHRPVNLAGGPCRKDAQRHPRDSRLGWRSVGLRLRAFELRSFDLISRFRAVGLRSPSLDLDGLTLALIERDVPLNQPNLDPDLRKSRERYPSFALHVASVDLRMPTARLNERDIELIFFSPRLHSSSFGLHWRNLRLNQRNLRLQ